VQSTLVALAMSGDEEAFASLARSAGDRLLAIAFRPPPATAVPWNC